CFSSVTWMNTDTVSPQRSGSSSVTWRLMIPDFSRLRTRFRHAEGERLTAFASSTLVMRASSCMRARMRQSIGSRASRLLLQLHAGATDDRPPARVVSPEQRAELPGRARPRDVPRVAEPFPQVGTLERLDRFRIEPGDDGLRRRR